MNLYIAVIGLISTVSCILIIICLNSKSRDPNSFPTQSNKSPIKRDGLTQNQKGQLLLVVCLIFFMSLVTTNVKSSKFSVAFQYMIGESNQESDYIQPQSRQIMYGDGKCNFDRQMYKYPLFEKYLKQSDLYDKMIQQMISENELLQQYKSENKQNEQNEQNKQNKQNKQLLILRSNNEEKGMQILFPFLCEKICKSSSEYVGVLYIDLKKKVQSQQRLMNEFKVPNYDYLKRSLCRSNGIEIRKQIYRTGGNSYQRQVYSQIKDYMKNKPNTYLIINNFQYILQTLLINQNQQITTTKLNDNTNINQNTHPIYSSKQLSYQLFVDKLFNQLIPICRLNVILHTTRKQSVSNLYEKWKLFYKINKYSISSPKSSQHNPIQQKYIKPYSNQSSNNLKLNPYTQIFPFSLQQFKGITKMQLYSLLKSIIQKKTYDKQTQKFIWKQFQNIFGTFSISNSRKLNSKQPTIKNSFIENDFELSLDKIQLLFQKIQTLSTKNPHNQKLKFTAHNQEFKILKNSQLRNTYSLMKELTYRGQQDLSIGNLKRKVSLKNINQLQDLGFLTIKQGKVYILD